MTLCGPARARRLGRLGAALVLSVAGQACTNGDLGRTEPDLVRDTVLPGVRQVVGDLRGVAVSTYPLTADETELRARSQTIIGAERGWSLDRELSSGVESLGLAEGTYQERRRTAHNTGRTTYQSAPWSRPRDTMALVIDSETSEFAVFGDVAMSVYRADETRRMALVAGAELPADDIRDTAGRIRENRRVVEQTVLSMRNRVDDYRLELRRSVVQHPDMSGRAAAAIERMARTVDRIEARLRSRVFPEERVARPRRMDTPRTPHPDLMGGQDASIGS